MSNKQVRVLVLGGRLTPSLVAVLSNPPDAIEFIVSRDTPERYKQAKSVLKKPLEQRLPASPLPVVPPFDWEACQCLCKRAVARHPGAAITFDVTTAPKFMSFAVHDFAKEHGHQVVVVDTARAQEVSLITRKPQPVALPEKVEDYLELFDRKCNPRFDIRNLSVNEQTAITIAEQLALGGEPAAIATNKFNRWDPGRHDAWSTPKQDDATTTDKEYQVFQMLEKCGLISELTREPDGTTRYRTSQNPADTAFIKGTWLEVYVWHVARSLRDKMTGEPLFSDCQMSFEIPHPAPEKREIDVGCLYQGQLIHCSCKARAPKGSFDKDHLDVMTGVSKLLGGDFTSRVLATNAFAPYDKEQWMFAKHAEKQKIVLVTGDELPEIGEILRRQAIDPNYARI
jgi:hypothetical protein